jgi:choline monooxygenase
MADHPDLLAPQPLATARTLPAAYYGGAAAIERDRRAVFAHSWQLVAREAQLQGIGDHVVAEVAGIPLLLVRGDDGALRAMHNVCRHRAGPLALCDGLAAKRLRCHYHGWTYALDGRLQSAPDMQSAEAFDPAEVRLPEAQVAQWRGLVFAATGTAVPPLADLLEGIDSRVGAAALAGYAWHGRTRYDIDCDWKVYVDNYLEGYHVPHIHPELNRMLDYRSYRTECARWHSLQWSPLESSGELYGDGEALYYWLWPNTMLNILPGRMQTNRVLPLGDGRCRVEFDFYYPPGVEPARPVRDLEFSDLVQREDVTICEQVQRGIASGSWSTGRLNPLRESGVHHFHELLRTAYRGDRAGHADART